MIAIWSNPDSWNSNATNSSGQKEGFDYGFKEWEEKDKFSTTFNLPKGVYLISILLDENLNNILDKNFIGIPIEQYGFSSEEKIRFRKTKFRSTRGPLLRKIQRVTRQIISDRIKTR